MAEQSPQGDPAVPETGLGRPIAGPALVVVSHYQARPIRDLRVLLEALQTVPAGWPFAVRVVVNREGSEPIRLPAPFGAIEVLERENVGYNIGAWEHGWRAPPRYDAYLFLQDECRIVREGWLAGFVKRASDPTVGLVGERISPVWNAPWDEIARNFHRHRMPAHEVNGSPVDRLACYFDFLRRNGIPAGPRGDHLQSLVLFARREVLDLVGGFPIGRNYGEAIASEIGISKRVQARGLRICTVGEEPFSYVSHPQWTKRAAEDGRRRGRLSRLRATARLLRPGSIARGVRLLRERGLAPVLARIRSEFVPADSYQLWASKNEPDRAELERQRETAFARTPRIGIALRVTDPSFPHLASALGSVVRQTYAFWAVHLESPSIPSDALRSFLRASGIDDARVLLEPAPAPGGGDDFVLPLGERDELSPSALFEVARAVAADPAADLVYSDHDILDERTGMRRDPHFKPDWSPDTLRGGNYVGRLVAFASGLVERDAVPAPESDYDLILWLSERARRIVHLPRVLYHARAPAVTDIDADRDALRRHLQRTGERAEVLEGPVVGTFEVRYAIPGRATVSVVIPNRDEPDMLARCVESIERTSYRDREVLIVENGSRDARTFELYDSLTRRGHRIVSWSQPFNFAALNNFAASQTSGDLLLFLNNDIQATDGDWLERLVAQAVRRTVGAVGAKLYYPDDTIQHAGVILGIGGVAAHGHKHFPRAAVGYMNRLVIAQNVSAVTAACLMMRRSVFEEVGGFDESFAVAYNDVDLCLKVREKGYVVIWTPHAALYHHESRTRGSDKAPEKRARLESEKALFRSKWARALEAGDPYYNRSLTLEREDFTRA